MTRGRRGRGGWRARGLVWGVTRVQGDFVGNLLGDLLGNLDIRDLVQGHDLWTLRDPTEIGNKLELVMGIFWMAIVDCSAF